MRHFLIGIAGGSGSGKSTIAQKLKSEYPDQIEIVHFDDYQKEEKDIPFLENMRNWDHPDAIDFRRLHSDLISLKDDKEVTIMTKSTSINPNYEKRGRIRHTLRPQRIIIIEGYLTFHDKRIRDMLDLKIYLDIPISESIKRREKITYNDESEYNNKILVPMHTKYVEPTKEIADLTIDVLKNNKEKTQKLIQNRLKELKILND